MANATAIIAQVPPLATRSKVRSRRLSSPTTCVSRDIGTSMMLLDTRRIMIAGRTNPITARCLYVMHAHSSPGRFGCSLRWPHYGRLRAISAVIPRFRPVENVDIVELLRSPRPFRASMAARCSREQRRHRQSPTRFRIGWGFSSLDRGDDITGHDLLKLVKRKWTPDDDELLLELAAEPA
jgi:hypothetical protein